MKIYLRNSWNFSKEAFDFYNANFELVQPKEAEVIVINDFEKIKSDVLVACNSTGIEHIKALEIISLRGEDLTDLTAVPELCLGMAIYLTRIFKGEEIRGKTLGLIGYGRIAHLFGAYAEFLGMNVIWYDKNSELDLEISRKRTLEELLKNSDIVSLHITADEENRNFMDREKFEMMKQGSIFLNSARSWLVDQEAFNWALHNKLSGSWVDFKDTVLTDSDINNLITTPHLGGSTKESKKKSELIIAKKLLKEHGTRKT